MHHAKTTSFCSLFSIVVSNQIFVLENDWENLSMLKTNSRFHENIQIKRTNVYSHDPYENEHHYPELYDRRSYGTVPQSYLASKCHDGQTIPMANCKTQERDYPYQKPHIPFKQRFQYSNRNGLVGTKKLKCCRTSYHNMIHIFSHKCENGSLCSVVVHLKKKPKILFMNPVNSIADNNFRGIRHFVPYFYPTEILSYNNLSDVRYILPHQFEITCDISSCYIFIKPWYPDKNCKFWLNQTRYEIDNPFEEELTSEFHFLNSNDLYFYKKYYNIIYRLKWNYMDTLAYI